MSKMRMVAMESVMPDSWSYETSSSANEFDSSPVSPVAPSSPTLYSPSGRNNNAPIKSIRAGAAVNYDPAVIIGNGGTLLSSVHPLGYEISRVAKKMEESNMPAQIDWVSLGYDNDAISEMTDLAGGLSEDSYNLEGILGLDSGPFSNDPADYDFPPSPMDPMSKKPWSVETAVINESSVSLVSAQPAAKIESAEDKENFEIQFQNIRALLDPSSSEEQLDDSVPIFQLSELETAGVLELVPIDNGTSEEMELGEEASTTTSNNPAEIIVIDSDEEEEEEEGDNDDDEDYQSQYDSISQPSSVGSVDSEDDSELVAANALSRGDFKAAAAAFPTSSPAVKEGRAYARILSSGSRSRQNTSNAVVAAGTLMMLKPERRGRKPSAVTTGKPWIHVKDKNLRKKEQNKTAATRYRQKKKLESLKFLEQEQVLLRENEELKKQAEELAKEIKIVKDILRTLFNSSKQKHLKRMQKR